MTDISREASKIVTGLKEIGEPGERWHYMDAETVAKLGPWVRASDYATLRAELDALEAKLAERVTVSEPALNKLLSDYKQLDELLCCSGYDYMGQTGCGCQGASLREEIVARILSTLTTAPITPAEAAKVLLEEYDSFEPLDTDTAYRFLRAIAQEGVE